MKRFVEYLRRLTLSGNTESSKRFISMYVTIVLITFVVFKYTNADNVEFILGELIAFVLTLLGLATYETVTNKNKSDDI